MTEEMTEKAGGVEYRFAVGEDGGAVVTRGIAHATQARVPASLGGRPVVALGDECFASAERGGFSLKAHNGELERVELPEGLVRIGRAAFRGCNRLAAIALPESLEQIDDLAFSCTSVASIRLPRACTHLGELALRTGPESLKGVGSPYYSKLDALQVDADNTAFCAEGGALCRRLDDGNLEAVLCPGRADELVLGRSVVRIAPTAFAGTYEVGMLEFDESVEFGDGCGMALRALCGKVVVRLTHPFEGDDRLCLRMPSGELQGRVFDQTRDRVAFDLPAFLASYDAALLEETDRLLQAKLMVARLARPLHLGDEAHAAFERILVPLFDTLCVQFGACNYWQGLEDMADAGLLDAQSIPRAVDVLTARADTTAAAYLLNLKRTRFAEGGWDYAL